MDNVLMMAVIAKAIKEMATPVKIAVITTVLIGSDFNLYFGY
jgi:hypothetical protein